MSPLIREKFEVQDFKNLAHLTQKVSAFESQHRALRREKHLKGTATIVDPYDADSDDDDEVATAEWTWGKALVSCPWLKEKKDVFDFDIKKANRIFDLLLEKKQLRLSANCVIPSAKELKGKRYCKFYNATSHNTNDCRIFRAHIQKAIEQGKIMFEPTKKIHDGH